MYNYFQFCCAVTLASIFSCNVASADSTPAPASAQKFYRSGETMLLFDDYQSAIVDFNKAIELDPKLSPALRSRGNAKFFVKDYQGAIADYNRIIELNASDSEAHYSRGVAKYNMGNRAGALSDMFEARKLGYADAERRIDEWNTAAKRTGSTTLKEAESEKQKSNANRTSSSLSSNNYRQYSQIYNIDKSKIDAVSNDINRNENQGTLKINLDKQLYLR
jgi:tetratricopeptide (TPR) repeat protein